ncbi:hypothetical protein [Paenibacillus sp. PAMC 26794]|uniref:hypothetical protein n=1 Tax=Paenibacillus sp. PAMC 26794 TaxID=1257080 RepID=UPI0002F3B2DF|nr:hypothetical protein [Paenibacillus sp. PAMC 26794]
MSRSDDAQEQEQEVVERLQQHMKVLDDAFEPTSIPSLGALEAQVRAHGSFRTHADVDVSLGYGDYGASQDFPRRSLYIGLS